MIFKRSITTAITTPVLRTIRRMTETQGRPNDLIFAPETEQYEKGALNRADLAEHPVDQFHHWFMEAKEAGLSLPESLTLSTCRLPSGRVSSRVVLMKELDKDGNVMIYSNWGESKKAQDIKSNPHVSLTWFWKELERQVRVDGEVEFMTNEESQVYFDTRPRASRIDAWASPQSQVVESRQELEKLVQEQTQRFEGVDKIPCPPFWGGIRVKPVEWEFFQGRKNRTHDRYSYSRPAPDTNEWTVKRLAP